MSTKLTKAVIPAAGFGTRMLPAAKSIPKEMLPILDRPTIEYVVKEAADAGLSDILLVTSRDKKTVEDHFDRAPELEARLAASGKSSLLQSIADLLAKVTVHSVRQPEQRGLGDAVARAKRHVGDEPFACMLGDTIFSGDILPLTQLAEVFARLETPVIALEEVPQEKVSRYGVIAGHEIEPGVFRIDTLVEKPRPEEAPSRLAICARYVLTPDIFACLERTTPGKGGEIQLTDALRMLCECRPMHGVVVRSRRHDIGNPTDWLKTNLAFARRDERLWGELLPLIRQLLG